MRSRKEQVQAHRFVTHRLVSALLMGDPESTETPMRRIGFSVFGSVMVAVLVAAGFGLFGLFKPGGGTPEVGKIIIEEETGVRYLYRDLGDGSQAKLHPVVNYASARLILNNPKPDTVLMSQNSLKGYPRGVGLGIPNAPDALPLIENLMQSDPWQVCSSHPRSTATATSDYVTQLTVLGVDGAHPLGKQAILVQEIGTDQMFLLWDDKRLPLSPFAKTALGYDGITPTPITTSALGVFQQGPNLDRVNIENAGTDSTKPVPGSSAKVGTVFSGSGTSYVLTSRGLVRVGPVFAGLIPNGDSPTSITAEAASQALVDGVQVEPEGFPQLKPSIFLVEGPHPAICGVLDPSAGNQAVMRVMTYEKLPDTLVVPENQELLDSASGLADRVVIPGGRGVLAQDLPVTGAEGGGTTYMVNEQGIKYGFVATTTSNPKIALGYESVGPVMVPGAVLDLLPSGVPLSQEAALQAVTQLQPDATPPPAN
ncbi:type VII secretion protein EccB [Phytomonospora endophytica]|uniref:Type VII secretion protein EccB n=1 Tax=Phytomonospora endophytica TaxID=714109 RepID=A0A841FCX3_9ACTN|nr:type VII secretion protein EccB [Phytomonospora endophytica]MBB6032853.1 type VII secretion protein EccB [Phytomonospora endophytica]GIG65079.1 type VII secretion protein EccB [Phytomonospora endophytica]